MRYAFVCETPFQLFNAINYASNEGGLEDVKIDAYIGKMFINHKVIENVCAANVFSNVYEYDYGNVKGLVKHTCILLPGLFAKTACPRISKVKYDEVFFSMYVDFAIALTLAKKIRSISLYDDGFGSYQPVKLGMDCITKKKDFLLSLLGKRWLLNPHVFYLNNAAVSKTTWEIEKREFPKVTPENTEFLSLLERIYGKVPDCYKTKKIIYLSQPVNSWDPRAKEIQAINNRVLDAVNSENVLRRIHPREKNIERNLMQVDDSGVLWEYICLKSINEDSVLISRCSTAQIMPKLIFDKEPNLVFIYGIYDGGKTAENPTVQSMQAIYRKPEKIHIVYSPEELEQLVNRLQ